VEWRATAEEHGLDADQDLAVAAYWFTAEAPPALQTCHHLHGGMGVDVTYPLHAYFSWVKDLTRALGGPHQTLDAVAAVRGLGRS
jgi:alkylation response protein AidB-like acyl-CoA dehydrogenase